MIGCATAAHRYSWTRNDILQNRHGIRTVRIVSDSLTVLKWLNGDYIVRDKTMKMFLDEINWLIAVYVFNGSILMLALRVMNSSTTWRKEGWKMCIPIIDIRYGNITVRRLLIRRLNNTGGQKCLDYF